MHYDFIEIGTSDYNTCLEYNGDQVGLSIEPIKKYQDKLPNKPNVTKVNVAISNYDGVADLFITPENSYLKGYATIIAPHRAIRNSADALLADGTITKSTCKTMTWKTLVALYNITSVNYVQIDTEGHDCIILNSILDHNIRPKRIQFEYSHVEPIKAVTDTMKRMEQEGYHLTRKDDHDMEYEL